MYRWLTISSLMALMFQDGAGQVINIPSTADQSQYILYTSPQPWMTAQRICRSVGATLATVDTSDILHAIKRATNPSEPWADDWDRVWTGLHRHLGFDQELIFDNGCTPFNLTVSGIDVFKDTHDYNHQFDSKYCLTVNPSEYVLEKRSCSGTEAFICERKAGTCAYNSVPTSPAVVAQTNATPVTCQSVCNQLSGCYLSGNYFSSHCVLLTSPGGSDVMYEKICHPVFSVNSSDTSAFWRIIDITPLPWGCFSEYESTITNDSFQSQLISTASAEQLCSSNNYIYTSTSSLDCPSEVIVVSPSLVNVTVTETSTDTLTVSAVVTATQAVTELISIIPSVEIVTVTNTESVVTTTTEITTVHRATCSETPVDVVEASLDSTCVFNSEVLVTQLMSTYVITSVLDCPSAAQDQITMTQSCKEPTLQIQPTTVTFTQQTICNCGTVQDPGVTSPEPDYQTTICKAYNISNSDITYLDIILESIVSNLRVDRSNLSKTIRMKTSASDSRASSISIGYAAAIIALMPLVFILLRDAKTIVRDIRKGFMRIKYTEDVIMKHV